MRSQTSWFLGFLFACALTGSAQASTQTSGSQPFRRDAGYEENLRWSASADQTITPARVIRWMMGMRGSAIFAAHTPAEFQPIVNAHNGNFRAVATIAYKF